MVSPTEIEVLAPTDREQLTLLTCYPFRWIGPAPRRLVWRALPAASLAGRHPVGPFEAGEPGL